MTLGEKIKGRRQKLGLTQQDLAGNDITRNMLSQIENDTALPSLSTLKMLSVKLKMPCGYFLSTEEDTFSYLKLEVQSKLTALYAEGKYEECITLANQTYGEENDDDTAFLRCEACAKLSEKLMHSGAMHQASHYASQVFVYAQKTKYETGHLRGIAFLVSAIVNNPNAPRLEFNEKEYQTQVSQVMRQDLYHYMIDDLDYPYSNPVYQEHILAKKLMRQNLYDQAYQKMEIIHVSHSNEPISAYVLWRLFGDMEICARNRRDFESAYKISTKRMSLLTAFQS